MKLAYLGIQATATSITFFILSVLVLESQSQQIHPEQDSPLELFYYFVIEFFSGKEGVCGHCCKSGQVNNQDLIKQTELLLTEKQRLIRVNEEVSASYLAVLENHTKLANSIKEKNALYSYLLEMALQCVVITTAFRPIVGAIKFTFLTIVEYVTIILSKCGLATDGYTIACVLQPLADAAKYLSSSAAESVLLKVFLAIIACFAIFVYIVLRFMLFGAHRRSPNVGMTVATIDRSRLLWRLQRQVTWLNFRLLPRQGGQTTLENACANEPNYKLEYENPVGGDKKEQQRKDPPETAHYGSDGTHIIDALGDIHDGNFCTLPENVVKYGSATTPPNLSTSRKIRSFGSVLNKEPMRNRPKTASEFTRDEVRDTSRSAMYLKSNCPVDTSGDKRTHLQRSRDMKRREKHENCAKKTRHQSKNIEKRMPHDGMNITSGATKQHSAKNTHHRRRNLRACDSDDSSVDPGRISKYSPRSPRTTDSELRCYDVNGTHFAEDLNPINKVMQYVFGQRATYNGIRSRAAALVDDLFVSPTISLGQPSYTVRRTTRDLMARRLNRTRHNAAGRRSDLSLETECKYRTSPTRASSTMHLVNPFQELMNKPVCTEPMQDKHSPNNYAVQIHGLLKPGHNSTEIHNTEIPRSNLAQISDSAALQCESTRCNTESPEPNSEKVGGTKNPPDNSTQICAPMVQNYTTVQSEETQENPAAVEATPDMTNTHIYDATGSSPRFHDTNRPYCDAMRFSNKSSPDADTQQNYDSAEHVKYTEDADMVIPKEIYNTNGNNNSSSARRPKSLNDWRQTVFAVQREALYHYTNGTELYSETLLLFVDILRRLLAK